MMLSSRTFDFVYEKMRFPVVVVGRRETRLREYFVKHKSNRILRKFARYGTKISANTRSITASECPHQTRLTRIASSMSKLRLRI